MTPPPDVAPAERVPLGTARETRAQLSAQRARSAARAAWGELTGEGGPLGSPARRRLRRASARWAPGLAAACGAALVTRGAFDPGLGLPQLAAFAALAAALALTAWRRAEALRAARPTTPRDDLELGALVLVVAFAVAQLGSVGGGEGAAHPVVYLAVGALLALLPGAAGACVLGLALLLEGAAWWGRGAPGGKLGIVSAHLGFTVAFAALYRAVLGARLAAGRRAEGAALARRTRELDERARQLRLLAASEAEGDCDRGERAARLAEAAVLETNVAAESLLQVAEIALRAHTVAVWLLSDDDAELRRWECRSHSDEVAAVLPAGEGPLGGVVRRRAAVRLQGDIRSANHYQDGARPRALLAVPLLARVGGHLRGVVLADRMDPVPFSDDEERLLTRIATEMARAVSAEALLRDVRRSREEKGRFYAAIERLNRTAKPREVFDAVLEVAAEMAKVDLGAVTLVEEGESGVRHRVARAVAGAPGNGEDGRSGAAASALEGLEFPDNGGLVACAVRLCSSLPGVELDPAGAVVLDEDHRLHDFLSVKVLPLKAGETVVGTLVLASRAPRAFQSEVVRQLEVVAMQAGDAILRARLFEATERLAITDGLTGLVNHRTFQVKLDEHLAYGQRYGKKVSVLLADIDHFKAVNDTYGHPVGDFVLRGVARILQREARATDVAARYGGEEFALVMPETDLDGALRTAERIRARVAEEIFRCDAGPLQVTLSVGVASFPSGARKKAELIELADAGLYHAKRHGRNQSVALGEPRGERRGTQREARAAAPE